MVVVESIPNQLHEERITMTQVSGPLIVHTSLLVMYDIIVVPCCFGVFCHSLWWFVIEVNILYSKLREMLQIS